MSEQTTLPEAVSREKIQQAMEAKCSHTLRLYANQTDLRGSDYRVMILAQAVDVAEELVIAAYAAGREAGAAQERERLIAEASRPKCQEFCPPWMVGHWRDWHRGHGCHLDDGKPRSEAGIREIGTGRTPPTREGR